MKLIKKCFILLVFVLLAGCAIKVTFKQDYDEVLASQENKKIYSKEEIQKRTKEILDNTNDPIEESQIIYNYAGISGKRIEQGLNEINLTSGEMDGILITHEHMDHIAGLGVMARRYGLPMYATAGTIEAICETKSVGKIDTELFHEIVPEETFTLYIIRTHFDYII